eukprot:6183000-Pleurochrysis_carterae.AAC.2
MRVGGRAQKYTTFLCTPGLQPELGRLASLTCTHRTHSTLVGGSRGQYEWHPATHAAYPPDLNMVVANAVAGRVALNSITPTSTKLPASSPPQS